MKELEEKYPDWVGFNQMGSSTKALGYYDGIFNVYQGTVWARVVEKCS